jgi:CheY-like chemotaxis protein
MANPTHIHQIVMNLCTNAAHAMEPDGGVLTVDLSQVDLTDQDIRLHPELNPGIHIKLSVSDTGRGIPEKIREKIFDPYFTTKDKEKGTGLGLSMVHGIIKNCGGAIYVYSEPGKGSVFHVYIPGISQEIFEKQLLEAPLPVGTETILFVDDEKPLVEMGSQMLTMLGYQVVPSTSPLDALEIFRNTPEKFDLVISDMTMPKMTGDKLAAHLLEIKADLPIILCTGFSNKISDDKVAELGVRALVFKPLAQKDLALHVRKALTG